MRTLPSLLLGSLIATMLASTMAFAQDGNKPAAHKAGVVPDYLLTLVIGTRFVRTDDASLSPDQQFREARVPLADFNDTDHCIDSGSLDVAKEYFRVLGRMLGKIGYYYHIPSDEIARLRQKCEARLGTPPKALAIGGTKIIAYGRVVPDTDAPALEKTLR